MLERKVDGIVRIRSDFSPQSGDGRCTRCRSWSTAPTPTRARIIQAYAQGAVGQWAARRAGGGQAHPRRPGSTVRSRLWFNEANDSRYFLVPGLIVLVMTLIGAFLTALVMAREWERGTLEALFVTPVRADEILLGKTIPYFVLGHDRAVAVPPVGASSCSRCRSRLDLGADRRVDALPAGRPRRSAC